MERNVVMFCKKCGNEMPDYATQCDKCGTMVEGSSTAKPGFNKLLFIPIGVGAVAVIALVVALVFLLRPKDDIVQPSYNSVQTTPPSESQAPVIVDNSPVTQPESTPSTTTTAATTTTTTIATDSQPTEIEVVIPDALSFNVNGVNIPVSEAGYVGSLVDGDTQNTVVLWGQDSKYVVMAMVNLPESLIKSNVTYTGLVETTGDPLATAMFFYDIENANTITGMTGSGISDQIVKIGKYSNNGYINLFVSGNLLNEEDRTTIPFNISGKFDYINDFEEVNSILERYYDALYNAILIYDVPAQDPVDTPVQEPVSEVVIAGKSYPLDADFVDLTGKGVTNADIENLKYLTNLTGLQISDNSGITDLSALSGLTKLESLWMDNTGISDLSPLSGCKNLREMGIKNTKVKDISVLSNFTKLEKFIAVNCNISDISSIANCPEMREIWLSYNPITDFSPLVGLNKLNTVGLNNCCSMTWDILETLYGLTFTKELDVSGNGITDEMAEALSYNLYSPDGNGQWWY